MVLVELTDGTEEGRVQDHVHFKEDVLGTPGKVLAMYSVVPTPSEKLMNSSCLSAQPTGQPKEFS